MDFSKFDKEVDLDGLKNDLAEVEKNGGSGERKEVPHGTYEVKVDKLELTESKTSGNPMVTCWFKVLSGEFKGSLIYESGYHAGIPDSHCQRVPAQSGQRH